MIVATYPFTPQPASTFFGLLFFLCWAATAAVIVTAIVARLRPESAAAGWLATVADSCLWLGFVVAAVTMGGSLYYSQVAGFNPCELCWAQRICVYPLAFVFLIAAVRRDYKVWIYTIAPAVIGVFVAAYHTQLQAFPSQHTFCQALNPCTTTYVKQWGFVTLPFLDLSALSFIVTMTLLARWSTHFIEGAPE